MIVVADASPLNYLIQLHADELLNKIFGAVLVPTAVMQELRHPRAPEAVAAWMSRIPSWIEVRASYFHKTRVFKCWIPANARPSYWRKRHARTFC